MIWDALYVKSYFSLKCPIYEMSCLQNVIFLEMSCLKIGGIVKVNFNQTINSFVLPQQSVQLHVFFSSQNVYLRGIIVYEIN